MTIATAVLALVLLAPSGAVAMDPAAFFQGVAQTDPTVHVAYAGPQGGLFLVTSPDTTMRGGLRVGTNPGAWATPRVETKSFYLVMEAPDSDPPVIAHLARLAGTVAAHDDGTDGFVREPQNQHELPQGYLVVIALAIVFALVVGIRKRGRVTFEFKLPHIVPATIQVLIFFYWSRYWPGVAVRAPEIVLQLVLAFAVDAAANLALSRSWKVGFGPFPIVLSANLFSWFNPPGSMIMVIVAVLSRAFIRRGGRHIFNPSALGLAISALLTMVTHAVTFSGTFAALNMAPNAAEALLLLALLPQVRFRIVFVSVAAYVGLALSSRFFYDTPGATFAGTLLTFALLITDPATMPETPIGRALFGLFVGFTMGGIATLLNMNGFPDDFSKVFPIPIANFLVPQFDRIGRAFPKADLGLFNPRWNLVHLCLWAYLVLPELSREKPRNFQAALHWTYPTPLIVRGDDGVPRCEDNPVFCRMFSFVDEAILWKKRLSQN